MDKLLMAVIPYVACVSEDIRHVCRKFGVRTVFRSEQTLRSTLTRAKDTLPVKKQSNVKYQIPCRCGKVYVGETKWRLETTVKEHHDVCNTVAVERSAIAEHVWENQHSIDWKEMLVIE